MGLKISKFSICVHCICLDHESYQVPYRYLNISVVDRHRFDADSVPTFRFDAEPDPDPISS
jgi:hypothetical protein